MTGAEVGAVFMEQAQTGSPMTYMFDGRQHIVVASGGFDGAELIAYRLPGPAPPAPYGRPRSGFPPVDRCGAGLKIEPGDPLCGTLGDRWRLVSRLSGPAGETQARVER